MHWANLRIAAFRLADSAGGVPPPGSFERQVRIADWNAGAFTLTPLTVRFCGVPARAWITIPPLLLLPGSGKFGTPWARMHLANTTGWPSLAAPLFDDDAPHAASIRALARMS